MSHGLDVLLLASIGQTAPEVNTTASQAVPTAQPQLGEALSLTEYGVFGAIGLFLIYFLFKALKSKPAPLASPEAPQPLEPTVSDEEIQAQAQRAFTVNEVQLGDDPNQTDVYRLPPEAAAAPTRDASLKDRPAKASTPVAAQAPAIAEPPTASTEPLEAAGATLREGLSRTHNGFVSKLGKIFGSAKVIDDTLLANLEEALFTADIGVRTSQKLVELVQEALNKRALKDPSKVWEALKEHIAELLGAQAAPIDYAQGKPFVIMVVGVNGAGKTTSIGKLAKRFADEGKKVLLAAGDTFRAAAVEQLQVWGERAGAPVVRGTEGQDPSSVLFEAIERAEREGYDICICDTAGRLQARKELMDELAKVHRVCGKASPGAPHEVWLVLDATNGQNAISQAKVFTEVVDVTGIVLTKLDGTAKGGVVIGISDEMNIPVRYIGIGEKVEDLQPFEPEAFAEALFAGS
jgi:fused signal recognition particle receptor